MLYNHDVTRTHHATDNYCYSEPYLPTSSCTQCQYMPRHHQQFCAEHTDARADNTMPRRFDVRNALALATSCRALATKERRCCLGCTGTRVFILSFGGLVSDEFVSNVSGHA